ncbi:MAG: NAD-dependent DNA ligase LigA [Lachnospiraceae bacterium]|nr:NAD-dependent DNA ligase LigA [Lachnospiraceae bacterium]
MNRLQRMKELVGLLQAASKAYYAQDREIMSNLEYDRLYDELEGLEKDTGIVLSGSPTVTVGFEAVDYLPKEAHEVPMLSLDKTKDREQLKEWLGEKEGILSWKLDGLTIVLTYEGGELQKAVTRGNGETGEVVTGNARVFSNLPLQIPYSGKLVLRGEAVITYEDFQSINASIEDGEARYKNPRNLCSGSVRQLNSEITAQRRVRFFAFSLVRARRTQTAPIVHNGGWEESLEDSRENQLRFLQEQGFEVVEYRKVTADTIRSAVEEMESRIPGLGLPSDGLVLTYEDISYGQSLGVTSKFPRDSIAFKWADELRETKLLEIEWSPSRTGLINPIAIFEPVELEGTTVSRASVHNLSVLHELRLGVGDTVTVYKANMIIPQIAENLTGSNTVTIPAHCPACGELTEVRQTGEAKTLHCTNPDCSARRIKAFTLFVSRDALNVDGLSEATLEKFIGKGFLREFADIFHLKRYAEEIRAMEGFGEKSCDNLLQSIEAARRTTLPRLLYGLGIPNIGLSNAKLICRHYGFDLEKMKHASAEELSEIEGVGEVIANAFCQYFGDPGHGEQIDRLTKELELERETAKKSPQSLEGLSFAITGSLYRYENRSLLKEEIEANGGRVTGTVTGKTTVLINNDASSDSSKNKKARELGVKIMTEDEFLREYLEKDA